MYVSFSLIPVGCALICPANIGDTLFAVETRRQCDGPSYVPDYSAARKELEISLLLRSDNVVALKTLAAIGIEMKTYDLVRQWCDRAMAILPVIYQEVDISVHSGWKRELHSSRGTGWDILSFIFHVSSSFFLFNIIPFAHSISLFMFPVSFSVLSLVPILSFCLS